MKTIFVFLLALTTIGFVFSQESKNPFVGVWTDTVFGGQSINVCQVGNQIFGAFQIGFFEGQLEADRRTVSGKIYLTGNTNEGDEGEFRISLDVPEEGARQAFIGWIWSTDGERMEWESERISDTEPAEKESCWARDASFDATIEGYYTSDRGDELHVCLSKDGFGYELSLNGNTYSRGPTLQQHKAGRGQWWSTDNYGGLIFSLVDADTLYLTTHTQDKHEVVEYGCTSGFATCSTQSFRRRGASSPGLCSAQAHLSNWEGYWSFAPLNGILRLRRRGQHVFGSWSYGVLEGQVSADSTVLTGVFFDANWSGKKPAYVDYYGQFTVHLSGDQQSFDGRWSLNDGGECKLGNACIGEWSETRFQGIPHEVSAYDVFQISPNHFSTGGSNNVDGAYTLEYNSNVYFYLCRDLDNKYKRGDEDEFNPIVLDKDGRQRISGTYTDYGTGSIKGSVRTDREYNDFVSFEPKNSTANAIWIDETGTGTELFRKISEDVLYSFWFVHNNPDLAFCDYETESNCGEIHWNWEKEADWEQCTYASRRVDGRYSHSFNFNGDEDTGSASTVVIPIVLSIVCAIFSQLFF